MRWHVVYRRDPSPRNLAVAVEFLPHGQTGVYHRSATLPTANISSIATPADLATFTLNVPTLPPIRRPRVFALRRDRDPTGISGTGTVALAAEFFPDHPIALCWPGQASGHTTLTCMPSLQAVLDIHAHAGASHLIELPVQPHPQRWAALPHRSRRPLAGAERSS